MPATEPTPARTPVSGRRRRLLKPAIVSLVVIALAGTFLGLRTSQANKETRETKKGDEPKVFELASGDLASLSRIPLGRQIPVSGSLMPVLSATVRAKVAAEVARVHVQEGQRVDGGQVLVTLESADLKARLDRELAVVAEARARLDLARKNEANTQALLEKAFISRNAYDGVLNSVQVAEANVKSAEAQAGIARRALEDAQVRSPFAGVVARRWVNLGDKVTVDAPVTAVVDLSRMELEAQIPVSEVPFVKVGQSIAFTVDGFAGRQFAGRVERISPSAGAGSRALSIFMTLPNEGSALRGGMFASGVLNATEGAPVDVLPVAAILEEGGQSYVLVVREGKVERRTVVLGYRNDERGLVEIREGLERDVPVVTVKGDGLKPGARATIKPPRPA